MVQRATLIDVTRSFIPIDPNSFPESLHTSGREESPENRIPVMAYKGYNFLPTAYGYKSYFGNYSKLAIDALNTRVDHVFIFMTRAFENILVALTETGIYTKAGESSGAWTHNVVLDPAPIEQRHYEWTFCIIGETLYMYRQAGPAYYKLTSAIPAGITVSTVVPNFLNMEAQIGIFRAEGRLGFWDSEDSISWSAVDDFSDFTPSLETLAGDVKFIQNNGRIITIKQHGEGFIIYSTKSIIYVRKSQDALYQWDPSAILSNSGISYAGQVAVSAPDTLHFLITDEGLKKIENSQIEILAPELTDYFKSFQKPWFLRILQNRYLFLECLDDGYLVGNVQFTEGNYPPLVYTFPGSTYEVGGSNGNPPWPIGPYPGSHELNVPSPLVNNNTNEVPHVPDVPAYPPAGDPNPGSPDHFCPLDKETQKGTNIPAPDIPSMPDKDPRTPLKQPVYTCWIAQSGVMNADNINWVATPCASPNPDGSGDFNMCPSVNNLTNFNQNETGKSVNTGGKDPFDHWTMTRFVQTQMAIWEREDRELQKFLSAIKNRSGRGVSAPTKIYTASCTATPPVTTSCTIGKFISKYSSPKFGWSKCSFWLTRYATEAVNAIRKLSTWEECGNPVAPTYGGWRMTDFSPSLLFATHEEALAYRVTVFPGHSYSVGEPSANRPWDGINYYERYQILTDGNYGGIDLVRNLIEGGHYDKVTVATAYNILEPDNNFGSPGAIESGFCKLTGWAYTDTNGVMQLAPAGDCTAPSTFPASPDHPMQGGMDPPISKTDGKLCGLEAKPATLNPTSKTPSSYAGGAYIEAPGTVPHWEGGSYVPPVVVGGETITWPAQTISLPGGTFLLQKGAISPLYPTFSGALVFDMHLKKWGKMRLAYKQLLDYSPINSTASGTIDYNTFGILSGILDTAGKLSLFDEYPTDSKISYGKVGYYRLGITSPEEVHVTFRTAGTGFLTVETSLGGNNLAAGQVKTVPFTNSNRADLYGGYPGKWFNIQISGIYDINYLEFRGSIKGRR